MNEMLHADVTDKILKAYCKTYNNLGQGFLEKVYARAVTIELQKLSISCQERRELNVWYEGMHIGYFIPDLIVEDKVTIELKALPSLTAENDRQLFNYLSASEIEVGLLLYFGRNPEFKRQIYTNDRKGHTELK